MREPIAIPNGLDGATADRAAETHVKRRHWRSLGLAGLWVLICSLSAAAPFSPESSTPTGPVSVRTSIMKSERTLDFPGVLSVTNSRSSTVEQNSLSNLNLLGIRYAKGNGVERNPGIAMRLFLRSAMQGYTPAMANLGTLYETGAMGHPNFQRAYAWVRAALSFGVPEEDHDATVLKLGMIAARLDPRQISRSEGLAQVIAARVVDVCNCSPGQETELAMNALP
jgi:Sel1 repeat